MVSVVYAQIVGGDELEVCVASTVTVPRRGELVYFPAPLPSSDPDMLGEWRTWFVTGVKHVAAASGQDPQVVAHIGPAER